MEFNANYEKLTPAEKGIKEANLKGVVKLPKKRSDESDMREYDKQRGDRDNLDNAAQR